jgi:hypothetical protein
MLHTFGEWIKLADERLAGTGIRCFVMPGNDDPQALEDCIRQGVNVESCDEAVVEFDGYTMLSLGYSNRTPWDSPRELDEDQLYQRIHDLSEQVPDMSRCVFNLHVPPYDSRLDTAAELDENFKMVLIGKEPHMIRSARPRCGRRSRSTSRLPRCTATSTSHPRPTGSAARSASTPAATTTPAVSPAAW